MRVRTVDPVCVVLSLFLRLLCRGICRVRPVRDEERLVRHNARETDNEGGWGGGGEESPKKMKRKVTYQEMWIYEIEKDGVSRLSWQDQDYEEDFESLNISICVSICVYVYLLDVNTFFTSRLRLMKGKKKSIRFISIVEGKGEGS